MTMHTPLCTLWKLAELSKEGVGTDTELMVHVAKAGAIVDTRQVTYTKRRTHARYSPVCECWHAAVAGME